MQNPAQLNTPSAAANAVATAPFQQAASVGRGALNPTELGALLATLGIRFVDDLAAASASVRVELQVNIRHYQPAEQQAQRTRRLETKPCATEIAEIDAGRNARCA